jgi:hypothetical protein
MQKVALVALAAQFWCLAIGSPAARAAEIAQLAFNGIWRGGAYTDDNTSQFSHCAAYVPYRSGITMFVAINRTFGWTLAFADPAWNLHANEQIPLSMTFDGGNPWSGSASVMNEHMVKVPMAENSALINAFRAAYLMKVEAAGQTFGFNLDGTSRLMVQLAQCVQTRLAVERGEPPPHFAEASPRPLNPAPTASKTVPDSGAALELAATRIATNLLLQADLPHARLMSASETPTTLRGRGAAWVSDAGLGAVEIVSATAGKDPNQVASGLVATDSAACKGDFASGRSSDLLDDKVITKAFTGCKDSTGAHAFRYFILQSATGDFIVYELTDSGGGASPAGSSPTSDARFQAAAVKAAFSP